MDQTGNAGPLYSNDEEKKEVTPIFNDPPFFDLVQDQKKKKKNKNKYYYYSYSYQALRIARSVIDAVLIRWTRRGPLVDQWTRSWTIQRKSRFTL